MKRTATWLKDNRMEYDPYEIWIDLIDSIPNLANERGAYALHVTKGGSDEVGSGTLLRPFKTIGKALSEVTEAKNVIFIGPGTYEEALTWPTRNNVHLVAMAGQGAVVVDDPSEGGTAVITVEPGDPGQTWEGFIHGVSIDHNGLGFKLDNTGGTSLIKFMFEDTEFIASGGTSLVTQHNGSAGIGIEMVGRQHDVGGLVSLDIQHADDYFKTDGMKLTGGLETGSGGFACELSLFSTEVKHEGITGGTADQILNAVRCWSRTGETIAALDTNDLTGSHTENII